MSDSDDDLLQNNVFALQNDNTTMCARGPKFDNTNITGLSYRNNRLTATMDMPVNFEREQYCGSMSLRSAPAYRTPFYSRSIYHNGIGSHRSMYNGRGESSASVHSIDTAASNISTADILFALSNGNANKYDLRAIKDACNRLMISQRRKRIEKRRKLKRFFKGFRHKSGEDSGEQGSDSSMSDGGKSSRTTICKENIPVARQMRNLSHFGTQMSRHHNTMDVSHYTKENPIFTDCTESIKQNTFRNMISSSCSNSNFGAKDRFRNTVGAHDLNPAILNSQSMSVVTSNGQFKKGFLLPSQRFNKSVADQQPVTDKSTRSGETKLNPTNQAGSESDSDQDQNPLTMKLQNTTVMNQKERFKKGFLWPCQRFNNTVSGQKQDMAKLSNVYDKCPKKTEKYEGDPSNQAGPDSNSDQEEIFRGFSVNQEDIQNGQRKRLLDTEDVCYTNKKKSKLNSPKTLETFKPSEATCNTIPNGKSNDFIFPKPKIPVKKINPIKDFGPEKLLAKSRIPRLEEEIDINFTQNKKCNDNIEKKNVKDVEDSMQSDIMYSNSDGSMRPSFIKRKLFTQKLDMAEHKNASCDSIGTNSPQNIYSESIRERNKARKLVTSQSCLSREVTGEDNNLLDLIHKIVPPDQINITNVANKSKSHNNRANDVDNAGKWDVSTVIANCDNQDISDTYTDEEIFSVNHDKKTEKPKKLVANLKELPQCNIVIEKLKLQTVSKTKKTSSNNEQTQVKLVDKERNKNNVAEWMKSFWDAESDTDTQFNIGRPWKPNMQKNQESLLPEKNIDKRNQNMKKAPNSKGTTVMTFRNCFNYSKLNGSLSSTTNQFSSDKQVGEINKLNSVVQEKGKIKVDKSNKNINAVSETGNKKDIVKENVPANNKNEETRKPKAKQCIDCSYTDKPVNTAKNSSKRSKVDCSSDKHTSNHKLLPVKITVKPKGTNSEPKQITPFTLANKATKSGGSNITKIQKDPVSTKPKRKSKEKPVPNNTSTHNRSAMTTRSVSSNTLTHNRSSMTTRSVSNNTSTHNRSSMTTRSVSNNTSTHNGSSMTTRSVSNNTSLNNISAMTTRSRAKLSTHSVESDNCSMNLSNISNRTLRFR